MRHSPFLAWQSLYFPSIPERDLPGQVASEGLNLTVRRKREHSPPGPSLEADTPSSVDVAKHGRAVPMSLSFGVERLLASTLRDDCRQKQSDEGDEKLMAKNEV